MTEGRRAAGAVAILTILGLIPRLIHFDLSVVGDELSTIWATDQGGLDDTIRIVAGDAEISPPIYFLLAWFSSQLGSAPELVRLPAVLAGVAAIPLTYLVGARLIGRGAGVVAAAAMAFNPFMVFYSTDARAYTVAIALLLGSTLAMLIAAEGGRARWWVAYAALSALAMYTHYTAAFILAAQLAWLLWAFPDARRAALLANVGAAALFIPWLPSMLADLDSPTTDVLEALQGDGFDVKRNALHVWAFGYPANTLDEVPGYYVQWVGLIGLAAGLIGTAVARIRARAAELSVAERRRWSGVGLALILALATPVAEALLLLVAGTDLFGARNLNTSSGGWALAIGALATSAGPWLGAICAIGVVGSFAVGTAKTLDAEASTIDFKSAAGFIEGRAGAEDVVVDNLSAGVTPVPTTSLDLYLPQTRREYRLGLATGPPPFLEETSPVPDANRLLDEAFSAAGSNRVFIVSPNVAVESGAPGESPEFTIDPGSVNVGVSGLRLTLPAGAEVVARETYPGIVDVSVLEVQPDPRTSR